MKPSSLGTFLLCTWAFEDANTRSELVIQQVNGKEALKKPTLVEHRTAVEKFIKASSMSLEYRVRTWML